MIHDVQSLFMCLLGVLTSSAVKHLLECFALLSVGLSFVKLWVLYTLWIRVLQQIQHLQIVSASLWLVLVFNGVI